MKEAIKFLLKYIPRPILIKLSLFFRKPVSLLYKGNNVKCTVCEKSFSKFLSYGYGDAHKKNRLCPYCLSLERHRLLWLYFRKKTDLFTEKLKVLHIAPEQPFIRRFKNSKNMTYITADLLSPIADVKTDIRDMHVFEDESFDVLICNHVMEHIDEEKKAFSEILRVLKPGGYAILQVPINYALENTFEDNSITNRKEREKIFGQYDHVRIYGRDYPERLRRAGFNVTEDDLIKSFTEEEIKTYRFDPNEIIYVCKK